MKRTQVDVEPLSDARWSRLEQGLFRRLDAERARAPLAAPAEAANARPFVSARWRAAAAVLLFAGAAAAFGGAAGGVALWRAVGPSRSVAPSRIVTEGSGTRFAAFGATLDIGASSTVLVSGDDDHGALVVLDDGEVEFEVAPRRPEAPFLVQAGSVRVRVVGTHFRVARHRDDVQVDVARGVVEVSSPTSSARVAAGEHWPAAERAIAAASPSAASDEVPSLPFEALRIDATKVPTGAPHAAAPSGSPASPSATVSSPAIAGASAGSPSRAIGASTATSSASSSASAGSPSRAARPSPKSAAPANDPSPPVEARPVDAPSPPSLQERYELAARIERRDPERALAIYRALSAGDDAWAQNALFAAGRLEADRGDDHRAQAIALLERYLARFPSGSNAADARALLGRLR